MLVTNHRTAVTGLSGITKELGEGGLSGITKELEEGRG